MFEEAWRGRERKLVVRVQRLRPRHGRSWWDKVSHGGGGADSLTKGTQEGREGDLFGSMQRE